MANRIHGVARLEFKDDAELKAYYVKKYSEGGYGDGWNAGGYSVSRAYHDARFRQALKFVSQITPGKLLDAGCGDGSLTIRLAEMVPSVTAIDIAYNAFTQAQSEHPNIDFREGNIEKLDFAAGEFDTVVSVETLEHVRSPGAALSEFKRVLKPGGHIVITYPTINRTFIKACHLGWRLPISEHQTEWSYAEVLEHCRGAGFEIIEVKGLAFDLGILNGLKLVSKVLSKGITEASLSMGSFPKNSLFIAILARKP